MSTISFAQQSKLKHEEYDPIHKINKLNIWLAEPNYGQIATEDADKLKKQHINYGLPNRLKKWVSIEGHGACRKKTGYADYAYHKDDFTNDLKILVHFYFYF